MSSDPLTQNSSSASTLATHLPTFPDSAPLEPRHQAVLSEVIRGEQPYSDYNFISLWTWDHENTLRVCTLNDNLVVRFQDYVDPTAHFYSLFGTNSVDDTAAALLSHSLNEGVAQLKLIPEFVVERFAHPERFVIREDRDSFDYIVATKDMIELGSAENSRKRATLHQFQREHNSNLTVRELDVSDSRTADQILALAAEWSRQTGNEAAYDEGEGRALARVVKQHAAIRSDALHIVGLYLDDQLAAFSISEVLGGGFAMGHYKKSNRAYKGLGVALDHYTARTLHAKGVTHINHEQDLGIEGLRQAKLAHHPVYFLKKFTVALAP